MEWEIAGDVGALPWIGLAGRLGETSTLHSEDFVGLAGTTTTALGLSDKIVETYPNRVNPREALWLPARAVGPQSTAQ
jgi:hypothetical protein